MFEYECWHEYGGEKWASQTYITESASKAKFSHYLYLQDGLMESDFFSVVKNMHCKKIGKAHLGAFFGDFELFDRTKKARGIEFAFMGMKIAVGCRMGRIVGGNSSHNLNIVFDGQWHKENCHPLYETVYYDNEGNVIADYRVLKINQ